MKHEIDLSKYCIRTDLAIESINDKIDMKEECYGDIKVNSIYLDDISSKNFNKKAGNYVTIEFVDVTDKDNFKSVIDVFSSEFRKFLKGLGNKCLIIGLGNNKSTPDSLGPLTVDKILVTNHLYELNSLSEGYRRVSTLSPGVMGTTGIETSDIIKSLVDRIRPDFLVVVDALTSSSIKRINKTIQITDTGIHPGSGIGNSRKEISEAILGIPVIAVGVPTTVDAVSIVSDTIDFMFKKFSYTKSNIDNPINKLIVNNSINYSKKDVVVSKEDKKELLGLVGSLSSDEVRQLIEEVLNPIGYNFIVTPKEIDFLVLRLSEVISEGLNIALHDNYRI